MPPYYEINFNNFHFIEFEISDTKNILRNGIEILQEELKRIK